MSHEAWQNRERTRPSRKENLHLSRLGPCPIGEVVWGDPPEKGCALLDGVMTGGMQPPQHVISIYLLYNDLGACRIRRRPRWQIADPSQVGQVRVAPLPGQRPEADNARVQFASCSARAL